MKRFGTSAALRALFLPALIASFGCNVAGPDVDRVQTNLVDKSVFDGEWWYTQTIVDVEGDAANVMGVFDGQMGWADLGVDSGQSGTVAKIRWVIDENFLYAYRAYELIRGGNDDGRSADFRGQPLAVFAIDDHVDVRYDYNATTGERTNVRVEDTSDRRWYERQFIRVDWSQNLVTSFYYLTDVDLFGGGRRESAPFFFQEGAHPEFPASYEPQFIRAGQDPSYKFADEWPAGTEDTVHYMSFVTRELYSPGENCLYYNIPCQTAAVTVRNAFLRVPPEHNYAVETQTHQEFDRFGTFRTYQRTYVRGGKDEASLARRCDFDEDCGTGGLCEAHVCTGGLSSDYGETDFLTFYRPRFNHFMDHLTDRECVTDWQCDGRHADTPGETGSVCDQAARRCTIPMAERDIRQVNYYLSKNFPRHLVKTAFEVFGDWNEAFMRGWRGVKGEVPAPTLPGGMTCQTDNPIAYCYCGSPDVGDGGTCAYKYDPFLSPEQATALGVVNPYDCYIRTGDGYTEPAHPNSYEAFGTGDDRGVYGYEFVGTECMLVGHANSCDKDPGAPCEELGDLRYQFLNYIQHGALQFGGVAMPLVDPTTGEFISSNANMAGPSVESAIGLVVDMFPVLRNEPGATERYFQGEVTRDYFENLGRVERPVAYASSGTDGYSVSDPDRPSIPVPTLDHIRGVFDARADDFRRLDHTPEGRAAILSDRMHRLAGTPTEAQLLESMGANGGSEAVMQQMDTRYVADGTSPMDPGVINQVSPFRDGFMDGMLREQQRLLTLGRYNMDPVMAPDIKSTVYKYWAEVFRDTPVAEASVRMQQFYFRGVMHHEMGHAVGLRHNFGGNFDRDNYNDGYFNVVLRDDLALPKITDDVYDPDADGFQSGEDVNRFIRDLRAVRDERDAKGMGNVMTNSVMDYDGDLSTFGGLGRYDIAAATWNAFNVVEAYNGDPRVRRDDSLNGITDPTHTSRQFMTYYRGGESCTEDSQCPSNQDRLGTQPVFQRCIVNPRQSRLPTACRDIAGTPEDESAYCVCSDFDEDFVDYTFNLGPYENDADGDGNIDHYPVDYLFCTDDRVVDMSWCSRFDTGESFVESIDNFRRQWEQSYPTSYYRRYRNTGLGGAGSLGSIIDAAKIYQHLFFRYYYEPGFTSELGPLGFEDQYNASIDGMNWMTQLVTMPASGSYDLDPVTNTYRYLGETEGMGDLDLPVGMGFPMWSKYQEGYFGFFRRERAGVFFDKYYALLALAIRDWGFSFTVDERFFINYFDLFPVEMTEFFGGLILKNDRWYGPRIDTTGPEPTLNYLTWFRGTCLQGGTYIPCRGPQTEVYPGPAVGDSSNEVLRDWATILALATFPVFYDTSFEQRLSVFKLGAGDGFTIADLQPDGTATEGYRLAIPGSGHATVTDPVEADYVIFESERFHTSYLAVKVKSRLDYNLEEEQLGFQLLRQLVDTQTRVVQLRALASPTAAEREELRVKSAELNSGESYLEYLIGIQRQYGISAYFL